MPDGLLFLAFALTLVANAVLIVLAMRSMRPGGALSDRPADPPRERSIPEERKSASMSAVAVEGLGQPAVVAPESRATADQPAEARSESPERVELGEDHVTVAAPPATDAPEVSTAPKRPSRTRRSTAARSPSSAGGRAEDAAPASRSGKTTGRSGNGRRRRFSLPPLDEDSEKVSRSIESFLSGGDVAADAPAATGSAGHETDADVPPTTVALVAITDAIPAAGSSNGHSPKPPDDATASSDDGATRMGTDAALAAVERSLRSAARGTDQVDAQEPGRFRVVLAAAGELAARAYLRRVRTSVEPILEELDPPRRLAVGTATVLGDPVDRADVVAERRLAAAIEADGREHRARDEQPDEKPRASGD